MQRTGLTSLLEASKRPRAAAAALCRCEWRRYQRWMVTAARFTCWMNLQGEGGSPWPRGPPRLLAGKHHPIPLQQSADGLPMAPGPVLSPHTPIQ